jgi:SMC interacting uncharacterized protein involved in chromosome segregation
MVNRKNQIDIEFSAAEAVKTIANAASEATKVIANAASEAAKVTNSLNIKNSEDHDLLIELKTKMDDLKNQIKDLNDGTGKKISDHEIRLNSLEKSKIVQNTMMTIGIGILALLTSIIVYHIFQI